MLSSGDRARVQGIPVTTPQRTIVDLPRIYINGGARGFLVAIDPKHAARLLAPTLVDVAV